MGSWATIAFGLLKELEGCCLQAYPDPATKADPWTIGYGATGANIREGTVWSLELAEQDLAHRISVLGLAIDKLVKVPIGEYAKAALISFAYNVGLTALSNSTLLKRLNDNDIIGAGAEFLKWDKAAGKVMSGLSKRRMREFRLFMEGFK